MKNSNDRSAGTVPGIMGLGRALVCQRGTLTFAWAVPDSVANGITAIKTFGELQGRGAELGLCLGHGAIRYYYHLASGKRYYYSYASKDENGLFSVAIEEDRIRGVEAAGVDNKPLSVNTYNNINTWLSSHGAGGFPMRHAVAVVRDPLEPLPAMVPS